MELTINRADLAAMLDAAAAVVEARNMIPILANVLLDANGEGKTGTLALVGTDLDIEVRMQRPATVAQTGVTTVPAKRLHELVRNATGDEVKLVQKDGQLVVTSGRSRWTLNTLPRDDFPVIPTPDFVSTVVLPAKDFGAVLKRVRVSASTETTRYYLNGVFVHAPAGGDGAGKLVLAATDGHKLTRWISDWAAPDAMPDIIIPTKMVAQLVRMADAAGKNAAITIDFSASKIRAELSDGGEILTGKLVDGTFPDYIRVIPTATEPCFAIDRDAMIGAVKRAALVATEKARAVKMVFEDGRVTVSCTSAEFGSAVEEAPGAVLSGQPPEAGFNAQYVATLLGEGEADVHLSQVDAGAPCRITYPDMPEMTQVLMPMRV